MSHIDNTLVSLDKQLDGLQRSVKKIMSSIGRKAKNNQRFEHLTLLLADKQAKLHMVADKLAENSVSEPVSIGQAHRILPDLTTDPLKFRATSKQQERFAAAFVTKGKTVRWADI